MAVSTTARLAIYNGALRRLGSRELATVTEAREPRRVLDGIWGTADRIVKQALERADWNFAIRAVEGVYSPDVLPGFGFRRAYDKPLDMRRLASLCPDEYFRVPLDNNQYVDEAGYWFTDSERLYIRYVSDDHTYGLDPSKWTEAFRDYLECDLAFYACERITNSGSKRDRLERDKMEALKTAKSLDAMQEGVKFPPRGSWVRSRTGFR